MKYDQKKELKNEGLDTYLRNLHTFKWFWSENIWSKSTDYLTVSIFWIDIYFLFFKIMYDLFFD